MMESAFSQMRKNIEFFYEWYVRSSFITGHLYLKKILKIQTLL